MKWGFGGIDISFEDRNPALTISFDGGFDDVYIVEKNIELTELKLQYEEVQAVKWANLDEILQMIETGSFIPYHRGKMELLFFMRNHMGATTRPDTTSATQ